MLVRDYMKMEAEKDDRTYGLSRRRWSAWAVRADRAALHRIDEAHPPALTNAEFQAVAGCGMIISAIQNQELRQGYAAQMVDEIRHTQLEMALRNYYVKHSPDPAGWDIGQKALYQHPGGNVSLGEFAAFNTGDPIDCDRPAEHHHRDGVHQHPVGGDARRWRSSTGTTPGERPSCRSSPTRPATWPTVTAR